MRHDICHDAFVLPYTAYLRVYQPITAFSPREQEYWRAYACSPDRPRRVRAVAAEHAESLRRLAATPPVVAPEHESGDAYVRRVGDLLYVCPWQTRLRSWLGFADFRDETPARVSEAFVPGPVARAAEAAFEQWRDRGEALRTQILTSTWTIPIPWFVPFDARERCLVLSAGPDRTPGGGPGARRTAGRGPRTGDGDAAPVRTLLYVTEAAQARRRLEHAIAVLRESIGENGVSSAAGRLLDWLSTAHPRSLLELDYGGLVYLLSDDTLSADHSVAEVAGAVTALEEGRSEDVLAAREKLIRRWKAVRSLQHAN